MLDKLKCKVEVRLGVGVKVGLEVRLGVYMTFLFEQILDMLRVWRICGLAPITPINGQTTKRSDVNKQLSWRIQQ